MIERLVRDDAGTMVIESAFVIPILALLAIGGFEASRIVARNYELQSAVAEAGAIVLAVSPKTAAERDKVKAVIVTSTALATNKVTLAVKYRCNGDTALKVAESECATGSVVSKYIQITLADTYTPIWTSFGIGSDVNFNLSRKVQIA